MKNQVSEFTQPMSHNSQILTISCLLSHEYNEIYKVRILPPIAAGSSKPKVAESHFAVYDDLSVCALCVN